MTLDQGLFCLYPADGSVAPDQMNGLPNVSITSAPGTAPDLLQIATFRTDGWLDGAGVLVRVLGPGATIIVTVYRAATQTDAPPNIQVLRLQDGTESASAPVNDDSREEIVAHIQGIGDVAGRMGEWIGERGSQQWIEGFRLAPKQIAIGGLEYQALLGRDWRSPWVKWGQFCGSRGMALPLLGFSVRLVGEAASAFDVIYSATFVDGTACGPISGEAMCQAPTQAQLEAFRIRIRPRSTPL